MNLASRAAAALAAGALATDLMGALVDGRFLNVSCSLGAPVALALYAFDEFGLTALHQAPPPARFPAGTHLRSLANHLAYGAVLSVTYRGLTNLREEAA